MSALLRQIARYVAQKAASDPELKDKAVKVAHGAMAEAGKIARQEDRAYAAGKSVRRALDNLLGPRT